MNDATLNLGRFVNRLICFLTKHDWNFHARTCDACGKRRKS